MLLIANRNDVHLGEEETLLQGTHAITDYYHHSYK